MSEAASAAAPGVAPYEFAQLEQPRPVSLRDVQDPIAAAREEAEQIRSAAREEGYADGRAAALAEVGPQLQDALGALQQAVAGVESVRAATSEAVERDAIELALQLAEKIVGGALAVQSERIVDVVRGSLRRLAERRRVTILVNPSDLEVVRAASESFVTGLGGIEHCEVQAERRIAPGGAIVRTEEGQIDARVQTQLVRAREVVELELGE